MAEKCGLLFFCYKQDEDTWRPELSEDRRF